MRAGEIRYDPSLQPDSGTSLLRSMSKKAGRVETEGAEVLETDPLVLFVAFEGCRKLGLDAFYSIGGAEVPPGPRGASGRAREGLKIRC